jgi:ABC-2 type transport system permease protein
MASTAVVIAIALAIGFRPTAGPAEWIEAVGLLALVTFALTWLSTAFGLVTKSVETASNAPLPLQFLPFLGSAIVPADSMPAGMREFAENEPFTPIIETLRGLLMGTHIGNSAMLAVGWCVVLALAGYLWARAAFNRA